MIAQLLAAGASDCERIGSGFFEQPANAVSGLAYIAVGIWIAARFQRRVARGFGVFVVLTGIGSIGYHGWDDGRVNFFHDLAFPCLLLFVVVYELSHLGLRRRAAGYWIAASAFALGLVSRLVGGTDAPWCVPGSAFQWHAFWHVATAVALGAWAWGAFAEPKPGELRPGGEVRGDASTARPRSSPVAAKASGGE